MSNNESQELGKGGRCLVSGSVVFVETISSTILGVDVEEEFYFPIDDFVVFSEVAKRAAVYD